MNTAVSTSKITTVLLIAVVALSYSLSLYFLDTLSAGVILLGIAFFLSKFTVLSAKQMAPAFVVGILVGLVLYTGLAIWGDWEFFVKFGFLSSIR